MRARARPHSTAAWPECGAGTFRSSLEGRAEAGLAGISGRGPSVHWASAFLQPIPRLARHTPSLAEPRIFALLLCLGKSALRAPVRPPPHPVLGWAQRLGVHRARRLRVNPLAWARGQEWGSEGAK